MSPASPDVEVFVTVEPIATVAVVIDPPTVNVVAAGAVGPKGPVGPAGGTTVDSWWDYALPTTPPPANGEIRTTPDPIVAGQPMTIYLSSRDRDGLYWDSSILLPGDDLVMRGTGGALQRCTVTDDVATVAGPNGYATIQGIATQVTGQIGKNKDIEVTFVRAPTPGPQGPPGAQGPPGPPGPQGAQATWTQLTQAQYDALPVKDPNMLYVIVG